MRPGVNGRAADKREGRIMNEQLMQMAPMWILAGISAGWLADVSTARRGYGLVADMAIGLGAAVVGGGVFQALYGVSAGMLGMFGVGFAATAAAILGQRVCWPAAPGGRERTARARLLELGRPAFPGTALERDEPAHRPVPARARALARMATTGIYLLRDIPIELQRAARARAVSEGTTLRQVLLNGVGEYAAGTWTPRSDGKVPIELDRPIHATSQ